MNDYDNIAMLKIYQYQYSISMMALDQVQWRVGHPLLINNFLDGEQLKESTCGH